MAGPSNTRITKPKKPRRLLSKRQLVVRRSSKQLEDGIVVKKHKRLSNTQKAPAATPCPQSAPVSPIDIISSPPISPHKQSTPELSPFEYRVQWIVARGTGSKREILKTDVDRYKSNEGYIDLWYAFKSKMDKLVDTERLSIVRTELSVCASTRSHPNDLRLDYDGTAESVDKLLRGVLELQSERKTVPAVSVSITVAPIEVVSEAPAATPRASLRSTPTNIMLISGGSDTEPHALQLTTKWLCSQKGCKNYQKMCYWTSRDAPENHLPVQQEVLRSWSAAIREGSWNIDSPPPASLVRLLKNKNEGKSSAYDGSSNAKLRRHERSASDARMPVFHMHFGSTGQEAPPWTHNHRYRSPPQRVSPELLSSQTCPLDIVADFFEWCKTTRLWSSAEHGDLDLISGFVDEGGYDLNGLKNVGEGRWKEAGLKEGHRDRIHASLRQFFVRRRQQRASGAEDEELHR